MNTDAFWLSLFVLGPAFGLVLWAWRSMSRLEEELLAFSVLERADFDIGTHGTSPEAATTWRGLASRRNAA